MGQAGGSEEASSISQTPLSLWRLYEDGVRSRACFFLTLILFLWPNCPWASVGNPPSQPLGLSCSPISGSRSSWPQHFLSQKVAGVLFRWVSLVKAGSLVSRAQSTAGLHAYIIEETFLVPSRFFPRKAQSSRDLGSLLPDVREGDFFLPVFTEDLLHRLRTLWHLPNSHTVPPVPFPAAS